MGIPRSQVYRLERAGRSPRLATVRKLAEKLDVPLIVLLDPERPYTVPLERTATDASDAQITANLQALMLQKGITIRRLSSWMGMTAPRYIELFLKRLAKGRAQADGLYLVVNILGVTWEEVVSPTPIPVPQKEPSSTQPRKKIERWTPEKRSAATETAKQKGLSLTYVTSLEQRKVSEGLRLYRAVGAWEQEVRRIRTELQAVPAVIPPLRDMHAVLRLFIGDVSLGRKPSITRMDIVKRLGIASSEAITALLSLELVGILKNSSPKQLADWIVDAMQAGTPIASELLSLKLFRSLRPGPAALVLTLPEAVDALRVKYIHTIVARGTPKTPFQRLASAA